MDADLPIAIAAMLTAAIAVFRSFFEKRKANADAASAISSGYGRLVDDLQEQVQEAKRENVLLREELRTLREKIRQDHKKMLNLESQLLQALERISVLEGENELLREQYERK